MCGPEGGDHLGSAALGKLRQDVLAICDVRGGLFELFLLEQPRSLIDLGLEPADVRRLLLAQLSLGCRRQPEHRNDKQKLGNTLHEWIPAFLEGRDRRATGRCAV
jgi:hypothetical protein